MDTVSLGWDSHTGEEVRLGIAERRQGLYVIGKTGTGKTTLLEHLIVQDIEAGLGVCVLDPHGDLINSVLARIPAEREHDVVLLDLADSQYPFGLNLFECRDTSDRNLVSRVATQAVEVFEKLWGETSWGPQLAQVLRNCAYTLIENQGYSLADLRRLLLNADFRARLVRNVTNPQVVEFWELEYNPMRPHDQQQLVRSTLNKVDEFLTPTVYPIVGYGETTIDLRQVMDLGNVLLIRLGVGHVGAAAVSLIGSMLVGQLFNAALSRQDLPPSERRQFNLYADEYHRFATPAFAELLAEARKYALATTLAHQFRSQLTDDANRGATLNAGSIIVFAVHGEDAEELAKQFDRTPPPPEVIGRRPRLSVTPEPVDHLIRSGHSARKVNELVDRWLRPWNTSLRQMRDGLYYSRFDLDPPHPSSQRYYYSRISLAAGLAAIDRYFVQVMDNKIIFGLPEEAELLCAIIEELRGTMGFTRMNEFMAEGRARLPEEQSDLLFDYVAAKVSSRNGDIRTVRAERRAALVEARIRAGGHKAEVDRLEVQIDWLMELSRLLWKDPILVDSGQWEPIYDRPRTYSDVEAEIASNLVALPKFRARCRVLTADGPSEHRLRTPEYDPNLGERGPTIDEWAVRERTRLSYCVPLDMALDSIRARQRGDDGPDSGTTVRRVPLDPRPDPSGSAS